MNCKGHLHKILFTTLILPLLTLTVQCAKKPSEPLRVGYIGSLSKKYSAMGVPARDGAILAVEEINSGGGIKGRKIELVMKDDASEPWRAAEMAVELAESGINIIIGPLTTASSTAVLPVINKHRILTISPTAAGENLEDKDDYFIKLSSSTKQFGEKYAENFLQLDGGKVVAILDRRNDPYCTSIVASFRAVLDKQGDKFIGELSFFSKGDVSYSIRATEALGQSPDSVFLCASPVDTALFSQHLKRKKPSIKLWSAPWGISSELLENGGEAVQGLFFIKQYSYSEQPDRYRDFFRRYRERFGSDPTTASMANFETINILFDSILDSSSDKLEDIKKTLLSKEKYTGLQYEFTIDAEGDCWRPMIAHTVKMGVFQKIDLTDYR